jgi:hypothetical protein
LGSCSSRLLDSRLPVGCTVWFSTFRFVFPIARIPLVEFAFGGPEIRFVVIHILQRTVKARMEPDDLDVTVRVVTFGDEHPNVIAGVIVTADEHARLFPIVTADNDMESLARASSIALPGQPPDDFRIEGFHLGPRRELELPQGARDAPRAFGRQCTRV